MEHASGPKSKLPLSAPLMTDSKSGSRISIQEFKNAPVNPYNPNCLLTKKVLGTNEKVGWFLLHEIRWK